MTNNSIVGGDYSVGADGSFPLLMSVLLFVNHWPAILDHYPQFRSKYPSGCAKDGKLVFRDDDFVLAGQVLLDMASHHHAESDSAAVYDEARGQRPLRPAASQAVCAFSIVPRHCATASTLGGLKTFVVRAGVQPRPHRCRQSAERRGVRRLALPHTQLSGRGQPHRRPYRRRAG